jgi:hypothetical protein
MGVKFNRHKLVNQPKALSNRSEYFVERCVFAYRLLVWLKIEATLVRFLEEHKSDRLRREGCAFVGSGPSSAGGGGGGDGGSGGGGMDMEALFSDEFISSVANSLDDFDPAAFLRTGNDSDFERDFGQWFNHPDDNGYWA